MIRRRDALLAALVLSAGCAEPPKPDAVAEAAYQRGFAALQSGDYATAKRELTEAQKGLPRDPYIALDLGVVCQNLGDRAAAAAQYRLALETGRNVYPRRVTDPTFSGETLAEIARADLATLGE